MACYTTPIFKGFYNSSQNNRQTFQYIYVKMKLNKKSYEPKNKPINLFSP